MLEGGITIKSQKIYNSKNSFYKAIWKLRDMLLVTNSGKTEIKGREYNLWKLTLDGIFLARILRKS
jgi:hypothetical protein